LKELYICEELIGMLCNLSLQIIPMVASDKVYPVIDQVISLIDKSGVKYVVGPMETTMEGELDKLLDIVKEAQLVCTDAGAERVISVIKIDYSSSGVRIDEKMEKYIK
jgi:uncharacterized protein YqgV (UPF0045/DUF77 family)